MICTCQHLGTVDFWSQKVTWIGNFVELKWNYCELNLSFMEFDLHVQQSELNG